MTILTDPCDYAASLVDMFAGDRAAADAAFVEALATDPRFRLVKGDGSWAEAVRDAIGARVDGDEAAARIEAAFAELGLPRQFVAPEGPFEVVRTTNRWDRFGRAIDHRSSVVGTFDDLAAAFAARAEADDVASWGRPLTVHATVCDAYGAGVDLLTLYRLTVGEFVFAANVLRADWSINLDQWLAERFEAGLTPEQYADEVRSELDGRREADLDVLADRACGGDA